MREDNEEPMELTHEPVPGYRKVFYVVLTFAVAFLAYVFTHGGH